MNNKECRCEGIQSCDFSKSHLHSRQREEEKKVNKGKYLLKIRTLHQASSIFLEKKSIGCHGSEAQHSTS